MDFKQYSKNLEAHVRQENPELADAINGFRALDRLAHKLKLLDDSESFADGVTWWPVISVLGTFSSGKSTFLNSYLGAKLQRTGNQAVDDKFTVITYSTEPESRVLPGTALDSDPRFPFYGVSKALEAVEPGEGTKVNTYLQLRTANSQQLQGKIFIDSPGFDADERRGTILALTDYIISVSDLVLVLFDARHPEPGAMQHTLEELVSKALERADADKFLYILNQIDATAREDNPEEVFAAWQRALAQSGLTRGRFYRIFDADAAPTIEDEGTRVRFESKRDEDLSDIIDRIHQVQVDRAYRITAMLDSTAVRIRDELMPRVAAAKDRFKARLRWFDVSVLVLALMAAVIWFLSSGAEISAAGLSSLLEQPITLAAVIAVTLIAVLLLRRSYSAWAARSVLNHLPIDGLPAADQRMIKRSAAINLASVRAWLTRNPIGWGNGAKARIERMLEHADELRQTLNDRFTRGSGASSDH